MGTIQEETVEHWDGQSLVIIAKPVGTGLTEQELETDFEKGIRKLIAQAEMVLELKDE